MTEALCRQTHQANRWYVRMQWEVTLTVTTTWKCNSSILFENGGQAYMARESYQVGKDFTLRSLGLCSGLKLHSTWCKYSSSHFFNRPYMVTSLQPGWRIRRPTCFLLSSPSPSLCQAALLDYTNLYSQLTLLCLINFCYF